MAAPTTASILIVNYNYGRYLSDAIDSALNQTWPNVQVVVVDDGSKDESALIMQTYGNQIETIYKKNGGQASGTNAAFPLLTGETVIFLDADDMLEPDAIEKTIGFFEDPEVIKVCWPFTIVDRDNAPTGEIRFRHLPSGNFRQQALRVGPASHYTPAHSGNFWRKAFLDQVFPVDEVNFRNVVDAYLFTYSPFFGSFRAFDEPLTRYRVHGSNISSRFTAAHRRDDWEMRAEHLKRWLKKREEKVSIERWRRKNTYYQRLDGIAKSHAKIGQHLPKDASLALVAGPLYDRTDMRPIRPVHRAPGHLLSPDRTEGDFRVFLTELASTDLEYIAVQGSGTWKHTNLGALVELLHADHKVLFENKWIVIARIGPEVEAAVAIEDAAAARPEHTVSIPASDTDPAEPG